MRGDHGARTASQPEVSEGRAPLPASKAEERLIDAVGRLIEKIVEATTALEAARGAAVPRPVDSETRSKDTVIEALLDDLQDARAECEALWQENEQLQAIRRTRGWILLERLRKVRSRLLGRR